MFAVHMVNNHIFQKLAGVGGQICTAVSYVFNYEFQLREVCLSEACFTISPIEMRLLDTFERPFCLVVLDVWCPHMVNNHIFQNPAGVGGQICNRFLCLFMCVYILVNCKRFTNQTHVSEYRQTHCAFQTHLRGLSTQTCWMYDVHMLNDPVFQNLAGVGGQICTTEFVHIYTCQLPSVS
jgi:hypothetical protein